MFRPQLEALVETTPGGESLILCPGPAKLRVLRIEGERLIPGSRLAVLVRDERVFDLCLPRGVHGVLRELRLVEPWSRCEHGQVIGRLVASADLDTGLPSNGADAGIAGGFAVRSPTHGTYYQRPSPGEPPYVLAGQRVHRGQVLGLVEVMKCFSPILFEPPAGVEEGTVRELAARDGGEVQTEQVLVRIDLEPAR